MRFRILRPKCSGFFKIAKRIGILAGCLTFRGKSARNRVEQIRGRGILRIQLPGVAQGSLFQSGGNLFAVLGEVFEGDAIDPEIVLQALAVGQAAQRAAEEEAVKAAEDANPQQLRYHKNRRFVPRV